MYIYVLGLGNTCRFEIFEPLFVYCAFEAKFLLRSFAAMPISVFAHAHFCNLNVWLVCHRKVEAVLLAVSAYFFSQAMLTGTRLVLIMKQ